MDSITQYQHRHENSTARTSPSFSVLLNNTNITKRCLPKLFISVKITKLAHHVVHKRRKKLRSKPTSTLPLA